MDDFTFDNLSADLKSRAIYQDIAAKQILFQQGEKEKQPNQFIFSLKDS